MLVHGVLVIEGQIAWQMKVVLKKYVENKIIEC